MSLVSIAIIGAGMAGLSAAQVLQQAGHSVQVFDKARGTGGRMATRRTALGNFELATQYFTAQNPNFQTALQSWQAKGWVTQCTPKLYQARQGVLTSWRDGLTHWMGTPQSSSITRGMLGTLPVQFNCRITGIFRNIHHWSMQDAQGRNHGPFSHVILAIPAPQAHILLSNTAPQLAERASQVSMEPIWAVAAALKTPLAVEWDGCFVADAPLERVFRSRPKVGHSEASEAWVLQATGSWSQQHLNTPKNEIVDHLLNALSDAIAQPIPPQVECFAHRWLYGRATQTREWGLLSDGRIGLYVCGDWCLSGRVEGAWVSGYEAAQRILTQG